jgi:hypothetical protein
MNQLRGASAGPRLDTSGGVNLWIAGPTTGKRRTPLSAPFQIKRRERPLSTIARLIDRRLIFPLNIGLPAIEPGPDDVQNGHNSHRTGKKQIIVRTR